MRSLYIPIWFYSNNFCKQVNSKFGIFTFQSGSIQITTMLHSVTTSYTFTFQSGSIQMMSLMSLDGLLLLLYIPIWFYSNTKAKGKTIDVKSFTFQSGSIQILLIFIINSLADKLYIPIWFYSNAIGFSFLIFKVFLYIPIWFYSNSVHIHLIVLIILLYIPIWFYSNGTRQQKYKYHL